MVYDKNKRYGVDIYGTVYPIAEVGGLTRGNARRVSIVCEAHATADTFPFLAGNVYFSHGHVIIKMNGKYRKFTLVETEREDGKVIVQSYNVHIKRTN